MRDDRRQQKNNPTTEDRATQPMEAGLEAESRN